jgi:hypothetical protein
MERIRINDKDQPTQRSNTVAIKIYCMAPRLALKNGSYDYNAMNDDHVGDMWIGCQNRAPK